MALQKAQGCGRRAGSPIQLDHVCLPPREELVQHRQIADDEGDEAKAGACFQNRKQTGDPGTGHQVAISQGEEGHAAHIKLSAERRPRRDPATYEPLLDGLASYLVLPLQGWSTSGAARDHWARGPRGTLARRLIEELSDPMSTEGTARQEAGEESRWRRLRSRLEIGRKE